MRFGEALLETLGRGGVILLAAIAINRTEWYQSITAPAITDPFIWLISIGVGLGMIWLFIPVLKFADRRRK